jgi:methionyl-tRNA synthetase
MGRLLVTSALPYANGPIHLGHLAGCYLPSDIYVRYHRLKGTDVLHICGTDEHGVPITIQAEAEGVSPQEIVDRYHADIAESFTRMGIIFDNFSRTTLPVHHRLAQDFFLRLLENGYMDVREVEQFYCSNCGRYLADRYIVGTCPHCRTEGARGDLCEQCGRWLEPELLIEPRCKICGSTPTPRKTTHWFFKLSAFQDRLEEWLDGKKDWRPSVLNLCRGWFREGLEDRPITRDQEWGVRVPLPEARGKVLYVWFDAPIGYISSTVEWAERTGDSEAWRDWWADPETKLIHFLAKDNIVFHAIIWPAMLMGYGEFVLPASIPANEFLNLEGRKLSTSQNWAVWVPDYLREFEPDPLRYCLTVNAPEGRDSDFSWRDFQARNNNELADILGNFVNRTVAFTDRYYRGAVPEPGPLGDEDRQLLQEVESAPGRIGEAIERFEFKRALRDLMKLSELGNKYFNDQEPWRTVREDPERCATTIALCLRLVTAIAFLCQPFLPFTAQKLRRILGMGEETADLHWDEAAAQVLAPGHRLGRLEILYRKIDDETIERQVARLGKKEERETVTVTQEPKEELGIEEFSKLDLRVALVKAADRVPGTDKLIALEIEMGGEHRRIVAGVGAEYDPADLVGKKIVVVANLKKAKIRGVESHGMLLAATHGSQISLVVLDRDIESGASVS